MTTTTEIKEHPDNDPAPTHGYGRAPSSARPIDEIRVHRLIMERVLAKKNREFDKADELRAELLNDCNVELVDKTKVWKVLSPAAPVGMETTASDPQPPKLLPITAASPMAAMHGYTRAGSDTALVADEPRVHALLLQRLQAKKNHQFDRADELRETLRRECGVEVFDKTKFWRVAGGRGHVPLPEGVKKPRSKPPPRPTQGAVAGVDGDDTADGAQLPEPLPSRNGAKTLRKREQAAAEEAARRPIASGFGHAMLVKMGWGGQGRGLRDGALAEPYKVCLALLDPAVLRWATALPRSTLLPITLRHFHATALNAAFVNTGAARRGSGALAGRKAWPRSHRRYRHRRHSGAWCSGQCGGRQGTEEGTEERTQSCCGGGDRGDGGSGQRCDLCWQWSRWRE